MIAIRSATPADAPRLLEIYDHYVRNTAITFECETPSPEDFAGRISRTLRRYPYIVIEVDGVPQGYAYAGPFIGRAAYDWSCAVSIYVARDARKHGLGRRLYEALEEALGGMGMLNLYACIGYPEVPDEYLTANSAEFHAHMGYRQVGRFHKCGCKFGRWYDMIWMEKLIGNHVPNPAPVR